MTASIPPPDPLGAPHDAVLLVGADGTVLRADEGACRMFAVDGGLQGAALEQLVSPIGPVRHLLAGCSDPIGLLVQGRRANRVPFPLEAWLTPGDEGVRWRLRELGRDRLAGQAQRYFDVAFDSAPIGMALFNSDGEYVRVNASLCRMLGRSSGELVGVRDQLLTHPDDRQADVDAAWDILEGREDTFQCEKRFLRPDGQVVWALANLTFLRDEAGRPLSWFGQFQDITARRAVEDALRRERDYSEAILAGMQDGFLLARDGRILAVNDALCRLTGFTREELLQASLPFPFWPPECTDDHAALRDRVLGEGAAEAELLVARKDGRRFHAAITASVARSADGAVIGAVTTVRDVSERRRHEQELARLAAYDPLTGLANRRLLHDRLREEVGRSRRSDRPLSLAVLDLDRFKRINDTFGHQAGDRVLAEVGGRLRSVCREGEAVARMGGEEFAWLLPETTAVGAYAAAERARRAIESRPFDGVGRVTVSIGVCELGDAGDADELYRLADVALYWAKAHGRNLVFRYSAATAAELGSDPRLRDAERRLEIRTMVALARTVDAKHPTTRGHAERVAELARRLALRAGWSDRRAAALHEAGLVHDVGKIAIPDAILTRPSALSEAEYEQVKTHAAIGAQMLSHVLTAEQVAWVRGHHERWDGAGYPDGLSGASIPAGARLLAAADAWDAMVHARVYAAARPLEAAVEEIRAQTGRQFCPAVAPLLTAEVGAAAVTGA